MNNLFQFGNLIFINFILAAAVETENTNIVQPVRIEPSLSTRDQFIIIGCVTGFTIGLLIALVVGCFVKCDTKMKKEDPFPEKDYNSLDKILSNDFPNDSQCGDRKLAKSAQMYHYQLSKQNLIQLEKEESDRQEKELTTEDSDTNEECTVYECPGLGTMQNVEIRNPLFDDVNSTADGTSAPAKDDDPSLPK